MGSEEVREVGAGARGEDSRRELPAPLELIYARVGLPTPGVAAVTANEIPEPYRSLLVHERDMTVTLEAHHDSRVALRTLATFRDGHWYLRKVLLVDESSGRPVEMGVIEVDLEAFSSSVSGRILEGAVPLGRLLRECGVDYRSRPTAFLAVRPNTDLMGVFWMNEPSTLYGRQTELTLGDSAVGNIVEILPLA